MSIGVSGIIKLKKYSVSNAVELLYEISRLATVYKIGFKMGGNVSEEVYGLSFGQLGRRIISTYDRKRQGL